MTQPPVPGRGAGAEPAPGAGLPGGTGGRRGRDPRLAGFAQGGAGDGCRPGAALAATLEELSGPECRCDGATDDELIGLLGRWQAVESWAAAGKLGVVRELIRRRAVDTPGALKRAMAPNEIVRVFFMFFPPTTSSRHSIYIPPGGPTVG